MVHHPSWYSQAWGKDEMRPVSGSAGRVWGTLGLQLLGRRGWAGVMNKSPELLQLISERER